MKYKLGFVVKSKDFFDSEMGGTSVYNTGPAEWQKKIAESAKTGEFKGIAVAAG